MDYLMDYPFIPEPSDFALKNLHVIPKAKVRVNPDAVTPRKSQIIRDMELVEIKPRVCRHCNGVTNRTAMGLCVLCGRFQ